LDLRLGPITPIVLTFTIGSKNKLKINS
jgi:hypothetical protein